MHTYDCSPRPARICVLPLLFFLAPIAALSQGTITTVAGNGNPGTGGDGGPAINAQLSDGFSTSLYVGTDTAGNFYITDVGNHSIRKVNANGIITSLSNPCFCQGSVAFDAAGTLYVASGAQVKKLAPGGTLTVIAGGIVPGFSGDGGPAIDALLFPTGVVVDAAGNIYVADTINNRIRKIAAGTGIITTIAGTGASGFSGDGGPAVQAALSLPQGMALDNVGNLYFADGGTRIRKIALSNGLISTVAGNGTPIGVLDNVAATSSGLTTVSVAVDASGNIYYTDIGRVRRVNAAGLVSTIAGGVTPGFSGDGGPATEARFNNPNGVAVDPSGNVYVVDLGNKRIRKITYSGSSSSSPSVSASVSQVRFAVAAGATPTSQTVSIGSTGAPFNFTTAVSTASGGQWLSAAASSNTTPATVTITANPAGLSAGIYSGSVAVSAPAAANSPLNIQVDLTVTSAATGGPSIVSGGIVNASGYQRKLAPDTVFVVFGRNMGPDTLVGAAAPAYPETLADTSISFTPSTGGAAVAARMVYTSAGQAAGLLPSSIAPGSYAVRVSYNGQSSAPESVSVVARSFGIATVNSAGSGPAQVTIGNVNGGLSLVRFTSGSTAFGGFNWTLTPAHAGDTLVLWGTGGGADPANDTGGTSGDQTAAGAFAVLVGGRRITPLYAGASQGYPGLWQINFTLPPDIDPDCYASLQVSAGGELSNLASIAIAPTGRAACVDSDTNASILSKLDNGGTIVGAAFGMARSTEVTQNVTTQFASGGIYRWTPAEWVIGAPLRGRLGQCGVYDRVIPANGLDPAGPNIGLDAGASLRLQGTGIASGAVLARMTSTLGPFYILNPAVFTGGATYSMSGTGGADMGPFDVSATFPGAFAVTNLAAISTVDRSQPITVNWTGTGVERVLILINSVTQASGGNRSVSLFCTTLAAPGTFVVPAASLAALLPAPATTGISITGQGPTGTFTANLTAGGQLDFGSLGGGITLSKSVTVR